MESRIAALQALIGPGESLAREPQIRAALGIGTLETPEFQRQSRDFAKALEAAGKPVKLIVAPGYNHFEVGESIGNPYAVLGRAAMDMMKLNSL